MQYPVVQKIRRLAGPWWWASAFLLILAVSIGTSQWMREHRDQARASWPFAIATVQDTDVHEYVSGSPGNGLDHRIYAGATVQYEVDGVQYETTADVNGLIDAFSLPERLPRGESVAILYNPRDPEDIYIDVDELVLVYSDLTWVVVVLVAGAILLVVLGRRSGAGRMAEEEQ